MANFQESIEALKEAGLAYSEIPEIISKSVDGQMHAKNLLYNKESGHELPTKNSDTNAETLPVRKRKVGVLSTEKQQKSIRQGSPKQNLEREGVRFDYSFYRLPVSPLSVGQNRFSFSADMDKASDLAERALNGEFPELAKKVSRDGIQKSQLAC